MSRKNEILEKENILREQTNNLSDGDKKVFYSRIEREIKDPDTYAVLNWFFLSGLHHFYLKQWLKGAINLTLFTIGVVFLFSEGIYFGAGVGILFTLFVVELNDLFNSQEIIQNHNNNVTQKILYDIKNGDYK